MHIITKKVTLLPAPLPPFRGFRLGIEVTDSDNGYGLSNGSPAEGSGSIEIDWGDGITETLAAITTNRHAYSDPGRYEVRISDTLATFRPSAPMPSSDFHSLYPKRLQSVEIDSDRLAELTNYAFIQSVNLKSVRIRTAAPLIIPNYCFANCAALERVELPTATGFPETIVAAALPFVGCSTLREIHFAEANKQSILGSRAYGIDPTLGTGVKDICRFDL